MFDQAELNRLYRFCYSLVVNETAAYDLLQNSLEKFLKSDKNKENNLGFMYQVIRHQFIDDYRKQSKQHTIPFEEQDYIDFDVKTLESISINEDLTQQILEYLDPLEREILFYWAVEGYTTQQIAEMLAMPKGTVLSKIYRMRQRIKQQFNDPQDQASLHNEAHKK
ncbi:MAG: RNA polymerase sigma factor [Methylococcales bacterium]|nr:RNA polymerase sigma factor [Methylococcales bacterium]